MHLYQRGTALQTCTFSLYVKTSSELWCEHIRRGRCMRGGEPPRMAQEEKLGGAGVLTGGANNNGSK